MVSDTVMGNRPVTLLTPFMVSDTVVGNFSPSVRGDGNRPKTILTPFMVSETETICQNLF